MSDAAQAYKLHFDLGSPYAWVIAERAATAFPQAEWIPVLQPDVDDGPLWDGDQERIIELAQKFDLLQPRFHEDRMNLTIADSRKMALAGSYAKSIGRTVAFSLAAFRQCFAAGRAVDEEETILLAAAACEMHPRAVLAGIELEITKNALSAAGEALRAIAGGRTELPVLTGPNGLCVVEDELISLALADFTTLA